MTFLTPRALSYAQKNIIRIVSIILLAAAFAFYSLVIFALLPPTQSQRYLKAAADFKNGTLPEERIFDLSPLYLQVHINALRFFRHPDVPVQWTQIALSSLSIFIFFHFVLRFFPFWLSVTVTIALLMQRSLIVYTQLLEPEPFIFFFLLLFFYFIVSSSQKSHLLAGVCLGLAILTRPHFGLLVPIIPVYFLLTNTEIRSKLKSILFCALPAMAAVSFLLIRTAFITGYFSFVWMNPGITIYEANNPLTQGAVAVPLPMVNEVSTQKVELASAADIYSRFARSITGRDLTLPEVNRYWLTKAINFMQDHPNYWMKMIWHRLRYFFHEYQWHNVSAAFWNENYLRDFGIPAVPFSIVSAMALTGMILGWRQWRKWLLIYAAFVLQLLFMIVVDISAQQRIAILPLFFFFLCAAVSAFYTSIKKLIWILIVLPLVWFFYAKTELMLEESRLKQSIRASNEYVENAYSKRTAEQWFEASESASRSLAAAPFFLDLRRPAYLPLIEADFFTSALAYIPVDTPQGLFGRGVVCIYANRPGEAEIALREALRSGASFKRDQYQSSQPLYFLARSSWIRGNKKEAEKRLREALIRAPGDPWCLSALTTITGEKSKRNQLFRYFDDINAQFFLGQAALEFGSSQNNALPALDYLIGKIPESRRARIMLAAGLSGTDQIYLAAEIYREALRKSLDPALMEKEILNLFRTLSERNPDDPEGLYMYGFVLRQYGHYIEALEIQRMALEKSQSPAIRAEIVELQRVLSRL
jgi:tetratricopeptide (TPR) repeat protein